MVLPLGDVEKTRIVPLATYVLIALNVVAYAVQIDEGERFTLAYAATPYEITHNIDLARPLAAAARPGEAVDGQEPGPRPIRLTLLTSIFLHGSPLHLAANMLFLWIFGDNVEEVLGASRYVAVYLACGLLGNLSQVALEPESTGHILGASGAIAGLMGAYVVWFPHNRVRVLVLQFITELPALVVVGVWIAVQFWEGFGAIGRRGGPGGGVAYLAHVGGALTGLVVAYLFRDRAAALRAMNEARSGWFVGPD